MVWFGGLADVFATEGIIGFAPGLGAGHREREFKKQIKCIEENVKYYSTFYYGYYGAVSIKDIMVGMQ